MYKRYDDEMRDDAFALAAADDENDDARRAYENDYAFETVAAVLNYRLMVGWSRLIVAMAVWATPACAVW